MSEKIKTRAKRVLERRPRLLGRIGLETSGTSHGVPVQSALIGTSEPSREVSDLGSIPTAPNPREKHKTDGQVLEAISADLEQQGEDINDLYLDMIDDTRLLGGLSNVCEQTGSLLSEYVKHSNRFSMLSRWDGLHDSEHEVTIPAGPDNLHHDGRPRREEAHDRFKMEYVCAMGVDPRYVLYFRVTQPADTPKPEYYWTSDFREVNHGLRAEGSRNGNPVVLVSTLSDISRNGGLMMDVNDDQGIAVRQIGLDPYDQEDALFSYKLYGS